MKKLFVIFAIGASLVFASFSGCEREEVLPAVCGSDAPAKDLPWLKNFIQDAKKSGNKVAVYQITFEGNPYFILDNCVQCPDALTYVTDCQGSKVCEMGGIMGINTCQFDEAAYETKKLIWKNK